MADSGGKGALAPGPQGVGPRRGEGESANAPRDRTTVMWPRKKRGERGAWEGTARLLAPKGHLS